MKLNLRDDSRENNSDMQESDARHHKRDLEVDVDH